MTDTYPMPEDGWVCFHCGERFRKIGTAQDHFGSRPWAKAACTMTAAEFVSHSVPILSSKFFRLALGSRPCF